MTAAAQRPLAGWRVWLSRPAHQTAEWAAGLKAAGAWVEVEPLIRIVPADDDAETGLALAAAERADIVIATSPNAIRAVQRLRPQFAPTGALFAVGDATARALQHLTEQTVQVPDSADTSEGLLAMSGLTAVQDAEVVLLSGRGGRRKLVQTLTDRGAQVRKIALYRREMASISRDRLVDLVNHNDAAVVTSGQALSNLCTLLGDCDQRAVQQGLARIHVVVPSPRVVQLTPEGLFRHPPRAAARMTVDAVVNALVQGTMASENNHF